MSQDILFKNITDRHGEAGRAWCDGLDARIERLSKAWSLTHLTPVSNMSWHYVARGLSSRFGPVCLKIGCDAKVTRDEIASLTRFRGQGVVALLDTDTASCALLLRCAVPGEPLTTLLRQDPTMAAQAYGRLVHTLFGQDAPRLKETDLHIRDWLQVLDRTDEDALPPNVLGHAKALCARLLAKQSDDLYLHGDLHSDNVVQDGEAWIAIDPKGIRGPKGFEVACFFKEDVYEAHPDPRGYFLSHVKHLADLTQVEGGDLEDWVYVRLVLAVCWCLEDNVSPQVFLGRLRVFFMQV